MYTMLTKILCVGLLTFAAGTAVHAGPLTIDLISVSSSNVRGDYGSDNPAVSGDGRFVAFSSRATTLVTIPTITSSTPPQVYLRDRRLGTTELISIGTDGNPANGPSYHPQVSADGRYIAFVGYATNLVSPPFSNQVIYLRDRQTGTTQQVIRNVLGGSPGFNYSASYNPHFMSADATRFAFDLDTGAGSGYPFGIYVLDLNALTLTEACTDAAQNTPDDACAFGAFSSDGSAAAFTSTDSGLVPNDTNGFRDAFAYNVASKAISRVSVNADDTQVNGDVGLPGSDYPALSGDGSLVAFNSYTATNLGAMGLPTSMLVVKDRSGGGIGVASANDDGTPGDSNGIYLPAFSDDGNLLAFQSTSAILAPRTHPMGGSYDIFLRKLSTNQLRRICRSASGSYANNVCQHVSASGDGHSLAFESSATNLVPGSVSGQGDIYIVSTDVIFDDIFADGFEP